MPTLREEIGLLHRQFQQELRGRARRVRLPLLLSWPVLHAAVRMELALLGRVRVNRPRPPEHHNARYHHRAILLWLLLLPLTGLFIYLQTALNFYGFWVFSFYILGCYLPIAVLDWLLSRKLLVVDTQWTDDAQLDAELEGMQEPEPLIWIWLLPFFRGRRQQIAQEFQNQAPRRRSYLMSLYRRRNLTEQAPGDSDEQDDAWQALKDHLHAVLVEGQAPDAQTTALLLLATIPELHRFSRLLREDATIYRLFAPEERQVAHERLTQLLKADPIMTMQLDPVLYDTLLFIRDKVLDTIKTQQPDTPGAKLSRVFIG